MRADEILAEIEQINSVDFPQSAAQQRLELASPVKQFSGQLTVYYYAEGNVRLLFMADSKKNVAAIAFFISAKNDRVWQAKNAATYKPYKGQQLVAELYRIAKTDFKKSIQSDFEQTSAGMRLWTETLPKIGLVPRVYDHTTDRVIDPQTQKVNVYPAFDDPDVHRYSWILERNDYYPAQNLVENSLLLPTTGKWAAR